MPECKSGMPAGNGTGNKRARALPEFQIWLRAGTGTQKFGRARAKNGHARARPITMKYHKSQLAGRRSHLNENLPASNFQGIYDFIWG